MPDMQDQRVPRAPGLRVDASILLAAPAEASA